MESQNSRPGWSLKSSHSSLCRGLGQFPLSQLVPTRPWTFQGCGKWDGRIPELFARSWSWQRGEGGMNIPFSSMENPTGGCGSWRRKHKQILPLLEFLPQSKAAFFRDGAALSWSRVWGSQKMGFGSSTAKFGIPPWGDSQIWVFSVWEP